MYIDCESEIYYQILLKGQPRLTQAKIIKQIGDFILAS